MAAKAKQNRRLPVAPAPDDKSFRIVEVQRERVLSALKDGSSMAGAAAAGGMTRSRLYDMIGSDETFRKDVDDAREHGTDVLIDRLRERAFDAEKPSDVLAMFLVKERRPSFRENYRQEIVVTDTRSQAAEELKRLISGIRERQVAALNQSNPPTKLIAQTIDADATEVKP
jgi:hypothetical protein